MSDFDQLGSIDGTALEHIDADGDGADDMASLDTDGDGVAEAVFLDHGRDGSFDHAVIDTDADGTADLGFEDVDNDGTVDQYSKDTDGDGYAEIMDVRTGGLLLDPSPPPPEPEVTTTVIPGEVRTYSEVLDRVVPPADAAPSDPSADGAAADSGPIVLDPAASLDPSLAGAATAGVPFAPGPGAAGVPDSMMPLPTNYTTQDLGDIGAPDDADYDADYDYDGVPGGSSARGPGRRRARGGDPTGSHRASSRLRGRSRPDRRSGKQDPPAHGALVLAAPARFCFRERRNFCR
jgi:hypothetical protein